MPGQAPTPQGTFVLGLGAQKAGTTWLHQYLAAAEGVETGALKEYHVWDARHLPQAARYRPKLAQLRGGPWRLRWKMQRLPGYYTRYFAGLLARPGVTLTADITPAYGALPAAVLGQIREGFVRRGIAVRAVFVMRDPVQRCWSTVRMHRRNGVAKEGVTLEGSEMAALLAYAGSEDAEIRTRYERIVPEIEAAFPADEIYYGLYETMFTPAAIAALSAFLGLPARPGAAQTRLNVSEKTAALDPAVAAEVAARFAPTYAFCRARFPETQTVWAAPGQPAPRAVS